MPPTQNIDIQLLIIANDIAKADKQKSGISYMYDADGVIAVFLQLKNLLDGVYKANNWSSLK